MILLVAQSVLLPIVSRNFDPQNVPKLTLNLHKVNIATYRITAIIGVIIGLYNMMNFFNPHTVFLGVVHLPLLIISLYSAILSYRVTK